MRHLPSEYIIVSLGAYSCCYSNRKGKLFFFYEFVIKIKWSGHTLTDPDNKCTGSIEVVNLSDENDIDSIDVSINVVM